MGISPYAAIVIGSKNMLMKVYEISGGKGFRTVDEIRYEYELGKEAYFTRKITFAQIEEICNVLMEFQQRMREYAITEFRCYATSAIRNAKNQVSVLNQIKYHKVTGEEPGKELKSWSYSVKEVADLLGVDEYLVYDLLKKNQMEAVIVDYWKRIPKESFQNWYKSQSRYRTKEDRKKDALLEDATITMPEMAQLLGTTRSAVYTILDNPKYSHFFEFIVIAEKKRITKESFRKFLEGQDRYKLDPSNDYEELAQEQNIALANFRRKKLSQTGIRGSNGNIKYLTFDEASYLAKVSRSMINKWADKGKFTVIKVGSRVRIRRDEFEDWMEQRDLERSMQ